MGERITDTTPRKPTDTPTFTAINSTERSEGRRIEHFHTYNEAPQSKEPGPTGKPTSTFTAINSTERSEGRRTEHSHTYNEAPQSKEPGPTGKPTSTFTAINSTERTEGRRLGHNYVAHDEFEGLETRPSRSRLPALEPPKPVKHSLEYILNSSSTPPTKKSPQPPSLIPPANTLRKLQEAIGEDTKDIPDIPLDPTQHIPENLSKLVSPWLKRARESPIREGLPRRSISTMDERLKAIDFFENTRTWQINEKDQLTQETRLCPTLGYAILEPLTYRHAAKLLDCAEASLRTWKRNHEKIVSAPENDLRIRYQDRIPSPRYPKMEARLEVELNDRLDEGYEIDISWVTAKAKEIFEEEYPLRVTVNKNGEKEYGFGFSRTWFSDFMRRFAKNTKVTEQENVEAENVEAENVEAENVEAENVEAENAEIENAETENAETESVEAESVEAENVETEDAED